MDRPGLGAGLVARAFDLPDFAPEVMAKARRCLLDYLSCAFEAADRPWSRQAAALARRQPQGAGIVGRSGAYGAGDAAFANAVAGHGLVREDMHPASIAHLGVVVWPALLALAETAPRPVSGRDLLLAAIVGYETGAQLGKAVMTPELARLFRPTGLVGPYAAALASARLLGLTQAQALSAFALAGNCSGGLNEWPRHGGSEMYFHPGFAVRNAIACIELAAAGATASPTILEGPAGFFAAYGRGASPVPDSGLALFGEGGPQILSVFHKAAPACNFAQSPCQAALAVAGRLQGGSRRIAAIRIATTAAALAYPGCDARGPFDNQLQAKMSIFFGVAATLARQALDESGFDRLDDPEITRLIAATTLVADPGFTAAFPARQGARVTVVLDDGQELSASLDDVQPADDALIRQRLRAAATRALGEPAAIAIEAAVDGLEHEPDSGSIGRLCAATHDTQENPAHA
ncbi:MmgE/PrpD family protein [Xylophilus rhododendri]|uniref:MmgE/PrpD family protein n=2 Tax=Xylophilus rhododendri TaxID=2697032 RepID=A0A857JFJ1_9BURK|nr:MmgE/PrpD family protein [Xylophilus rhododendri]